MPIGQFAGVPTDSVIILQDPEVGANEQGHQMGYLRSLPYLFDQGVQQYTFPPGWLRMLSVETFDEVLSSSDEADGDWYKYRALSDYPFDYTVIGDERSVENLRFQHLCQLTNQETGDYSDANTTHKLLRAYLNDQIEELFLVTDTAGYSISGAKAGKPLREELDHTDVLSYTKIAKQYIRRTFDSPPLPLSETLNIWLQHAAADYLSVMNEAPTRIADLFDFDELEPGIRTWDLCEFLATDLSRDTTDHINATVRPWVESDISLAETNIRNALQEFEYDRDAVRRFRETGDRPN